MRLIIRWRISDGCTFSCENVEPAVYESSEAFICAFEKALVEADKQNLMNFTFANIRWYTHQFVEDRKLMLPSVYTVDEWFQEIENK